MTVIDVEDGHTLHLVTRPIPSQSTHAVTDGINGDELGTPISMMHLIFLLEGKNVHYINQSMHTHITDPFSNVSRDQPGHISRSVLVGTFNIPDRGGVILPEINRVSLVSSLDVNRYSLFRPDITCYFLKVRIDITCIFAFSLRIIQVYALI